MAATTGLGVLLMGLMLVALAASKTATGVLDTVSTGASGAASVLTELLAEAIATAEGFYQSGSLAQRQQNPGNLTDSSGTIRTFATLADGWSALYTQIDAMLSNQSAKYNSGMSLSQIGDIYANHDPNWSKNVSAYIGVSPDTTLDELQAMYS